MRSKIFEKLSLSIVFVAILGTSNVYAACGSDVNMSTNGITTDKGINDFADNELVSKAYVISVIPNLSSISALASGYATVQIGDAIWLDRNLGAHRAATRYDDHLAYGDLYQWGRGADGHEKIHRYDSDSAAVVYDGVPGPNNTPNSYHYLITDADWRSESNSSLWDSSSPFNPCPYGFRLPTQTELVAALTSESISKLGDGFTANGKFRLTAPGYRGDADGNTISMVGSGAWYWTSSTVGNKTETTEVNSAAVTANLQRRGYAFSVRCISQ